MRSTNRGSCRRGHFTPMFICGVLVALLGVSVAPVQSSLGCVSVEGGSQGAELFVPGKTYKYNLETEMQVQLKGNDPQATSVRVQAQVSYTAGANCEHSMTVQKFGMWTKVGEQKEIAQKLTKELLADIERPVRFSMKGQKLGNELLADSKDSIFSLNIKRGLISLLQGNPTRAGTGEEYDVFGLCPISISEVKGDSTNIFLKRKDLTKCEGREHFTATGLVRSSFNSHSDVKSTPIMSGDYVLEQRIKVGEKYPEAIQLTEDYEVGTVKSLLNVKTDAAAMNSVKSKVVSKLVFLSVSDGKLSDVSSPSSKPIRFESLPNGQISTMNTMKTTMKNLIEKGFGPTGNVQEFTAEQFLQLVRLMRDTKKDDLLTLFQQVKSGNVHTNTNLSKKLYFDALFRANSADSVEAISNLVSREMDATEKKLAYMSLQFAGQLNKESLSSIQKLMDMNPSYEAYLVTGTLIHKYCEQFECQPQTLKSIMDKFAAQLKCTGKMDKKAEHQMIAILKGLKNSEQISQDSVLDKIYNCYQESVKIKRVRVQSVKTISAAVCHTAKGRDILKTILKEKTVDPEFRIHAYLGLIKNCPDNELITYLQGIYNQEETNQLMGFLRTHIQSLKMTTDPSRQKLKELVRDFDLSKHSVVGVDFRKTSFNYEHSYNLEAFGVGGSVDSNVIFTKNGFLPRSVNMNFSAEVFGRDYNFLEFELRQENLESIGEKFFGPRGYFATKKNQEIVDEIESSVNQVKTDTSFSDRFNYRRRRRDAINLKDESTKFNKMLNNQDQDLMTDLDLDLSVNMFGSEVKFLALSESQFFKEMSGDALKGMTKAFNEALDKAKNWENSLEAYHILLDTEFEYPTGIGIPLKARAQVSMATKFGAHLKFDLRDYMFSKTPSDDLKFQIEVAPSMSLNGQTGLYMDVGFQRLGMQLSGNVYTSVNGELDFQVSQKGQKWNMDFRMKEKKQEFVKLDHKIIFVQQDKGSMPTETPLKFHSKKRDFQACFDQLYPYMGMTFCADYSFTVPDKARETMSALGSFISAPLNGPNRLGVWIDMDKEYNFQMLFEHKTTSPQFVSAEFMMNCPHPQYNRMVKIRGELGLDTKLYAKLALESPFKSSSVEFGYTNDNKEVVLYADALDDTKKYVAKIGFQKVSAREYKPIFYVIFPDRSQKSLFGYDISGKIFVDEKMPKTIYTFENLKIHKTLDGQQVPDEPLLVNGKIEYQPISFIVDLKTERGGNRMAVKGNLALNLPNLLIEFTTDSNNQDLNTEFHYDFNYEKNKMVSQALKLKVGNKKDYDVFMTQVLEMDQALVESKKSDEFYGMIKKFELILRYSPLHPVKFEVKYNNDKNLKYDHSMIWKCSQIDFNSDLKLKKTEKLDYALNYDLHVNKFFVKVLSKLASDGSTADLSKRVFTNQVALSNGFVMDLNGNFNHKLKTGDFDLDFENRLVDNTKKPQYKIGFNLKNQPKQLVWNLIVNVLNQPTDLLTGKFTLKKNEQFVLEMLVRDIVQLTTDFKFSEAKTGKLKLPTVKGDGFVLLKFPKVNNHQVKANTKFLVGEPNYDLNVEIFYDFEKDNSRKITFNTNNVIKPNEYHTKNSIDVCGSLYQLNGNYLLTGLIDDGTLAFDGQVILPSTRTFSADFKRKLTKTQLKEGEYSFAGNVDFLLKDTSAEKGQRTISVNGKLNQLNVREEIADLTYKIELADFDRSNIIFEPSFKASKGQRQLGLNVFGKMLPEKFSTILVVKNEFQNSNQINYDLKAAYGKSLDLTSVGHFKLGGSNFDYKINTKAQADAQSLQKTIPQASYLAKFRSVEFNLQGKSSGSLQQNFEWHFKNEAVVNGQFKYHANIDFLGDADSFFTTRGSLLADQFQKSPFVFETSYMINKKVELATPSEQRMEPSALQKTAVYQFFKNGGEFVGKVQYFGKEETKVSVNLDKTNSELHILTGHLTSTNPALKDHKAKVQVQRFDASSFTKMQVGLSAEYFNSGALWYKAKLSLDSNPDAPVFEAELDNLQLKLKSSVKFSSKINREANQLFSELIMFNFPMPKFDFHGKLDWSNYQLNTAQPLKLTVHVECPNWQLQGFEATVKGNKLGQKATIEVNATNKGKNVVAGQLEMAEGSAGSGEKSILLEGSGNLKWQDGAKRQLTFTLLRKKIGNSDRHMEFTLNGQLDKKNFLFELQILDGTTIARHSICMNGDQSCTNIEMKSQRKSATFDTFEHDFVINFDVRPLGDIFETYYNNFGLTFNTKKQGFDFSNDFNLFVENKQRKYQVSAHSKNPGTTIEITYPGRKMAMEIVHRLPTLQKIEFDFGSTVWLNKASAPNNKLEIRATGNANGNVEKNEWKATFSSYLQHPKMKKISVDGENTWNFNLNSGRFMEGKIVFDIFRDTADKITIQMISNKEFKVNELIRWDFAVNKLAGGKATSLMTQEYFVSLKQHEMVAKLAIDYPEPKFVNFDMSISRPKHMAKLQLDVVGSKLIHSGSTFDPKDNSLSVFLDIYHFASSGHADHACIKATGRFVSYTAAQVHIECDHLASADFNYDLAKNVALTIANDKKVEMYKLSVALDQQKFLDTQYMINKAEWKNFGESIKAALEKNYAQVKSDVEAKMQNSKAELVKMTEDLQKNMPDVGPVLADYKNEAKKLYQEVQADPTLKHICDVIEKYATLVFEMAQKLLALTMDFVNKMTIILKEYGTTMWQLFHDNVLPILMDFLAALQKIGQSMLNTFSEFFNRIFDELSAFFGKYQEQFNKIFKQVAEQLRELYAVAIKFTTQLRTEIENMVNTLLNFVKETVDLKKWLNRMGDLLREYKIVDYVKQASTELKRMVTDSKITPEARKFLVALIDYVSVHLTTPPTAALDKDKEIAELKNLASLFVDAIGSVYRILQDLFHAHKGSLTKNQFAVQFKDPAADMSKWQELLKQNFISIPLLSPVGGLDGEVPSPVLKFKSSGINYLTSADFYKSLIGGDWSRVLELARLSNWIPPYKYQAQIIDGAHFMTFDGLHYTFAVKSAGGVDGTEAEPEGCYFVLAADSVHSNFTVFGTFNNKNTKKLNSIIVADKANNFLELKANDKIYYNNKLKELPLHQEVHAWRNGYGQTEILHPSGVHIQCERNLEICSVTVNGYYKNKLRGMLGNANDEKIDELQLQNGEYMDIHGASYDPFYQNYQLKKFNKACPALISSPGGNMHDHHGHHGSAECENVFKNFDYFEKFLPFHGNYKEACEHATMMTEGSKMDTACTIARGFVRKLSAEYGIPARVPSVCHKECSSETEYKDSKVNNKKLDLLLIVDFNSTMYIEMLPELINGFKATLKTRDVQDLNLHVIGFHKNWRYPIHVANPDANPKFAWGPFLADNVKTMPLYSDMKFTTKCPHVNQFLESYWIGYEKAQVDLGLSSDARAFQYAAQFPFRGDAFKMMLILRSDTLKYTPNVMRTFAAGVMNGFTTVRGIHMHLMAPIDEFTLTGGNAKNTKNVVGFNEKLVVQIADVKKRNNIGQTNLRANVQYKSDMGTDMVLRNFDGNDFVFPAQNFQAKAAKDRKVYVQTMVNMLGEQIPRWDVSQKCHCTVFEGLYEKELCLVKESNLLAQSPRAPQRRG